MADAWGGGTHRRRDRERGLPGGLRGRDRWLCPLLGRLADIGGRALHLIDAGTGSQQWSSSRRSGGTCWTGCFPSRARRQTAWALICSPPGRLSARKMLTLGRDRHTPPPITLASSYLLVTPGSRAPARSRYLLILPGAWLIPQNTVTVGVPQSPPSGGTPAVASGPARSHTSRRSKSLVQNLPPSR